MLSFIQTFAVLTRDLIPFESGFIKGERGDAASLR